MGPGSFLRSLGHLRVDVGQRLVVLREPLSDPFIELGPLLTELRGQRPVQIGGDLNQRRFELPARPRELFVEGGDGCVGAIDGRSLEAADRVGARTLEAAESFATSLLLSRQPLVEGGDELVELFAHRRRRFGDGRRRVLGRAVDEGHHLRAEGRRIDLAAGEHCLRLGDGRLDARVDLRGGGVELGGGRRVPLVELRLCLHPRLLELCDARLLLLFGLGAQLGLDAVDLRGALRGLLLQGAVGRRDHPVDLLGELRLQLDELRVGLPPHLAERLGGRAGGVGDALDHLLLAPRDVLGDLLGHRARRVALLAPALVGPVPGRLLGAQVPGRLRLLLDALERRGPNLLRLALGLRRASRHDLGHRLLLLPDAGREALLRRVPLGRGGGLLRLVVRADGLPELRELLRLGLPLGLEARPRVSDGAGDALLDGHPPRADGGTQLGVGRRDRGARLRGGGGARLVDARDLLLRIQGARSRRGGLLGGRHAPCEARDRREAWPRRGRRLGHRRRGRRRGDGPGGRLGLRRRRSLGCLSRCGLSGRALGRDVRVRRLRRGRGLDGHLGRRVGAFLLLTKALNIGLLGVPRLLRPRIGPRAALRVGSRALPGSVLVLALQLGHV